MDIRFGMALGLELQCEHGAERLLDQLLGQFLLAHGHGGLDRLTQVGRPPANLGVRGLLGLLQMGQGRGADQPQLGGGRLACLKLIGAAARL